MICRCRVRQKQDTTSARSWDVAAAKSTQKFSSQEKASPKPEKKGVTAGSGFWYLEGRWHGCKFDLECWEDKDGVLSIFTRSKRVSFFLFFFLWVLIAESNWILVW